MSVQKLGERGVDIFNSNLLRLMSSPRKGRSWARVIEGNPQSSARREFFSQLTSRSTLGAVECDAKSLHLSPDTAVKQHPETKIRTLSPLIKAVDVRACSHVLYRYAQMSAVVPAQGRPVTLARLSRNKSPHVN